MSGTPKRIDEDGIGVNIRKIYLVIATAIAVGTPLISGLSAHYSAQAAVEQQINNVRYESAEKYADKNDMKDIRDKLETISSDVSEIKGYLKETQHY